MGMGDNHAASFRVMRIGTTLPLAYTRATRARWAWSQEHDMRIDTDRRSRQLGDMCMLVGALSLSAGAVVGLGWLAYEFPTSTVAAMVVLGLAAMLGGGRIKEFLLDMLHDPGLATPPQG